MDSIFSGYKFVPKEEVLRDPAVEELQPDVETIPATTAQEQDSRTNGLIHIATDLEE